MEDALSLGVLAAGLRTRAATIPALADAAQRDEDAVTAAVAQLARLGFLRVEDGVISYEAPERALSRSAHGQLNELQSLVKGGLDNLETLFSWLPTLVRQWEDNGPDSQHNLRTDVYHGRDAVKNVWPVDPRVQASTIDLVLPDASRLLSIDRVQEAAWHSALQRSATRVRLISAAADVANPVAAKRINSALAAGIEARMLPDSPSWFWVMGEESAALPLSWGESQPSSVIVVHSATVASVMRWVFEQLWARAVPLNRQAAEHDWDSLLRLLHNGATVDSASRALGISPRTGRRRLAEAMGHHGVDNLFALGAAWAAQQR
ncbi:MAG TPA: hypothetical protein VGL26_05505 [Jatrophihabitans sp.]|jgi:hypothetical protein